MKTVYDGEDNTERTGGMLPNNDLQFITITDPSQSKIPGNKKLVRSQAMRYARKRLREPPQGLQSSSHLGASWPPALKAHCPHIQPPGSAICSCILPNDVGRNQDYHEAPGIDLVAANAWYHSPVSVLGSGRIDPFGIFPVEMKPYMNFLFDYYAQISGQVKLVNPGSTSPLSVNLMPLAESSEAILQGLLCVATSHVTVESGGQTPRQWEIYHRGEAIRIITAGLSDPVKSISDEIVMSIILICGYDILFGHYEDLETHLKGVDRIVAVRGGLDKLGCNGALRAMVSWANHFRKNHKEGRFPDTSGLALPKPSDLQIEPHVSRFMDGTGPHAPSGILRITLKGLISLEVFKSINTLCLLFIEKNGHGPKNSTDAMKLNDRCRDIRQALNDVLHSASKTVFEECCVLAMLIYEHTLFLTPIPVAAPSRDLKNALEQTSLSLYWSGDVKFWLWVLFIGYASSHIQAQKSWFAGLIRDLILNTKHQVGVDDLKAILEDHLYSEAHFGSPYRQLSAWLLENS